MTDTFSRSVVRNTPRQAMRRPLYDPSLDESIEFGAPPFRQAEPTDPSIWSPCGASPSEHPLDLGDEPTLDKDGHSVGPQASALRGIVLAIGLLGGGAAVAAALLFACAAALGIALMSAEAGPTIAGEGEAPSPRFDIP